MCIPDKTPVATESLEQVCHGNTSITTGDRGIPTTQHVSETGEETGKPNSTSQQPSTKHADIIGPGTNIQGMVTTRHPETDHSRASKQNELQHHMTLGCDKTERQEETDHRLQAPQPVAKEASEVQLMQLDNTGESVGQGRVDDITSSTPPQGHPEDSDPNCLSWAPPHQCPYSSPPGPSSHGVQM